MPDRRVYLGTFQEEVMNRAQINRRMHEEAQRAGLQGLWLIHTLRKAKRASRWR